MKKFIVLISIFIIYTNAFSQRSSCGPMSYSSQMCAGSSQLISGTPISGATTYRWVIFGAVSGTYIQSPTNSPVATLVTSPNQNSQIIVEVRAFNSLGTIQLGACAASIQVSSGVPTMPSSISWNGNLCLSQTKTYTCQDVSAPSYTWEVPAIGFSQITATNQILLQGNSFLQTGSYSLRVRANSGCGSSNWYSTTIQVNSCGQEY